MTTDICYNPYFRCSDMALLPSVVLIKCKIANDACLLNFSIVEIIYFVYCTSRHANEEYHVGVHIALTNLTFRGEKHVQHTWTSTLLAAALLALSAPLIPEELVHYPLFASPLWEYQSSSANSEMACEKETRSPSATCPSKLWSFMFFVKFDFYL